MRPRTESKRAPRPRHEWLYALPAARLPARVTCGHQRFEHVRTFKHDFFAATGLYRSPNEFAVLKMGRQNELMTIPMGWLGAFLTRREVQIYEALQEAPGVPRLIGTVGSNGFLHEYIPGHPLARDEQVPDAFFDVLQTMIEELHARHIAYVDLNKRQNILRGDDGQPYLIDFQISLYLRPTGWRRLRPVQWLLRRFQQADRYHCLKHKRRLRPDLLSEAERIEVERLSVWIRLHRWLARPLTNLRRRTLRRLGRSETAEILGSSAK